MKYMGSKYRIAKHLVPILLNHMTPGMDYVEPFVGGANIIDKIPGNNRRIGYDNNPYLIAMFRELQSGRSFPMDIDKSLYDAARHVYNGRETEFKHIMEMDEAMLGWIGFMASANGRFFDGGFSGKSHTKTGIIRDYVSESIRNVMAQDLSGIIFRHSDYKDIVLEKPSLIYCDPPYRGTKQYDTSKGFDYDFFYQWCRLKKQEGHTVIVSEYSMPDDFVCIWEKEVSSSLKANGQISGRTISTEKIFIL